MRNSKLIVITRRLLTPDKIPGINISAWFSTMESGSVILDGTTASRWSDISGNNRHVTQAIKANQPTYTPDGLNGKPALSFDGADWLFNANPGALFRNVAGGTVAAVMNYTNAIVRRIPIATMNAIGNGVRFATELQAAGTLNLITRKLDGGAGAAVSTPPAYTNGTNVIQIGIARYPDGALDQFVNGSAAGTGSFPSSGNSADTDSATLVIGGTSTDDGVTLGNSMLGLVSEVLITNTALSHTDRQQLEGYFAWRRELQANLANNHPFKFSPPYI